MLRRQVLLWRVTLLLLVLPLLGWGGCTQSAPVTDHGVPVTTEALATAARVAKTADLAGAAAVKTLTAGIQAGVISREVGQRYIAEVAPKMQASLDNLRTLLQQQNLHPEQVNAEHLAETMRRVQEAVSETQLFVAQAQKATTP